MHASRTCWLSAVGMGSKSFGFMFFIVFKSSLACMCFGGVLLR